MQLGEGLMKCKLLIHGLALAAIGLLVLAPAVAADSPPIDKDHFNADMRKLWEDHVTWTRLYIVEAVAGLPSKDATAQRLLKNQDDIGNAIKTFYGDAAGTKLTALLKQHILTAAELVDAAKAGDKAKQDDATKRWYANADEIAAFLSGANPKNWVAADTKKMMHDHLDLTTKEVVAQLGKDWNGSIAAFDDIHKQILHMADALSSGIEKQFPNKFKA
jgi:hypothetical protein